MPHTSSEEPSYPSRRALRLAAEQVAAEQAAAEQAVSDHPAADPSESFPSGELLTPMPTFERELVQAPGEGVDPTEAPAPRRRRPARLIGASFALACVGGLTAVTVLPAFSNGAPFDTDVAARAEQQLQSSGALDEVEALNAIGSVELGVDPNSYKQVAPEAGLLDPSTLENTDLRLPFDREWPLTDGFAYRTAPVEQFHDAQDIAAADGTPVLAIGSGTVLEAGYATDGCGFSAKLQHKVNEETVTSRYCHMQVGSHELKVGQRVSIGDQIGRVGNTGMSFGSHLHLALRRSGAPIDPLPYINERIERQQALAAKRAK